MLPILPARQKVVRPFPSNVPSCNVQPLDTRAMQVERTFRDGWQVNRDRLINNKTLSGRFSNYYPSRALRIQIRWGRYYSISSFSYATLSSLSRRIASFLTQPSTGSAVGHWEKPDQLFAVALNREAITTARNSAYLGLLVVETLSSC